MAEVHKVADLEGSLLDAAVAMAEGHEWEFCGDRVVATKLNWNPPIVTRLTFMPSTDWHLAGRIIERERIAVEPWADREVDKAQAWAACVGHPVESLVAPTQAGPTPCIAAMRAYVESKFGEEVSIG